MGMIGPYARENKALKYATVYHTGVYNIHRPLIKKKNTYFTLYS